MSAHDTRTPLNLTDLAAGLLVAAQAEVAFYIYRYGPTGPIAMHFDIHGHANGWADRHAVAMGVAALCGVTALVSLMLQVGLFRQSAVSDMKRTIRLAQGLVLAIAALVTVLLASLGLAQASGLGQQRLPLTIAWLMFVIVGAFVGKAAPNAFIGVRVYWTLRSRLAWDKANRLLGRIFFFGGLIGALAMPFIDLDHDFVLVIAGLVIVAAGGGVLAIIESWRVWRADPERIP
jgi:uncharacterized membrane protein